MRIAEVTLDGNLPRYGIGLAVVRLSEALARGGDEVTLLCRAANARALAPLPNVRVVPLEKRAGLFGGRFAYVRQVRRALLAGVDVVHVHGVTRVAHWLLPARARRGAPLVVTCHSTDELGPAGSAAGTASAGRARRHARQAHEVLVRADAVVTPSRWFSARVAALAPRREAVRTIALGPTDETPVARRAHEGFVVLALARLVAVKGLARLVDAFAAAFEGDPVARLVLAGDGPERDALLARARAAGVFDRVALPGYLDGEARRAALAEADVVAVPTLGDYETFGLSALDASSAGVPVVVSSGGALPERVERGEGIAVPPGNVAALADALRRVRAEPARWGRLGDEMDRAAGSSPWDRVAAEHRALYGEVANRSNRPTG